MRFKSDGRALSQLVAQFLLKVMQVFARMLCFTWSGANTYRDVIALGEYPGVQVWADIISKVQCSALFPVEVIGDSSD